MSRLHKISGCDLPDRDADVVFVHGLGDDAFAAWQSPLLASRDSWPYWLGEAHPNIAVWSLGYEAAKSRFSGFSSFFSKPQPGAGRPMELSARGVDVLNEMVLRQLGNRPLFFIAHSLGGLVVKQVLRLSSDSRDSSQRAIFDKSRAVLFLATPHFGAAVASLVDNSVIFGATVCIGDLRAHDDRAFSNSTIGTAITLYLFTPPPIANGSLIAVSRLSIPALRTQVSATTPFPWMRKTMSRLQSRGTGMRVFI